MSEMDALHEAIRLTTDPMALMDRIVDEALRLIPTADGASLEVRRDAETLEYLSAAGTLAAFVGLRLPVGRSLSGAAAVSGDVQMCADALTDDRVNREAVQATGIRSMVCVPLSSDPDGVAVLKVSSAQPRAFTEDDAQSLTLLTRFLAATVDAASRMATVTADLLTELDATDRDSDGAVLKDHAARFVANVMTPGLVDRVEVESTVRAVLAADSFEIALQPIVDLATGGIVACEALSRFRGPPQRSPDWWFASAHRVGLGVRLEQRALEKALEVLDGLPEHMILSVNVGVDLLLHPHFCRLFDGQPLDRIILELTEHDSVGDYSAVIDATRRMRAEGARLSVDDTGSGYSGLTHILRLRPDVIKLDREMVSDIDTSPAKRALASALVGFAHDIDAQVVAEGIERAEEADCLRTLGADLAQGYLYARPMPPAELVALAAPRQMASARSSRSGASNGSHAMRGSLRNHRS